MLSINITQNANKLQFIQQSNHVLRSTFIHSLVPFLPTLRRENIRKGIHPIPTTLSSYKCPSFPSNHQSSPLQYYSSHFLHPPHTFPWKEVWHGGLWLESMVFPNHIGKRKHVINSYIARGLLGSWKTSIFVFFQTWYFFSLTLITSTPILILSLIHVLFPQ